MIDRLTAARRPTARRAPFTRAIVTACAAMALAHIPSSICAQTKVPTGRIVGRVIDAQSGQGLTDVGIQIVGTTLGTTSGVEGRFQIAGISAGTITLQARRIGYTPKTITGIILDANATLEQRISLEVATLKLQAQVTTAFAEKGSVSKALDEQRTAAAIVNSTTAEQIARSPDSDAAQAVKRVSGVTVQDGKYVIVRGLGERYTQTSLNGARVPSPEPEKKVVPLDLFPSALIEGITTSKTFTPDQQGDFSGANVDIKTRDFPARRSVTLSASSGVNSAAWGKSVLSAPTVGMEWLGYGGGERSLPGVVGAAGNLGTVSPGAATNALLRAFRNVWTPQQADGSANSSFGASVGGEDAVFGHRVGYVLSTSYSYGQEVRAGETNIIPKADGSGGASPLSTYSGSTGRSSVLWGGLANVSTWIGNRTRVAFNNTYNRTADNEARILRGFDEQWSTDVNLSRLSFIERSVLSNQLRVEHALQSNQQLDWMITRSSVTRDEPDRADMVYWQTTRGLEWKGQSNDATRTFSALDERDVAGSVDYKKGFGASAQTMLKVGVHRRDVHRDSDSRSYDLINLGLDDAVLRESPEQIFDGRYFTGGDRNLLISTSSFGGRYSARDAVSAGYAMLDLPLFTSRLRAIVGARIERADLGVRSRTPQGIDTTSRLRNTDVLPAISLTYALTDRQNLRVSATQTLSRPEYRELSPIAYNDVGGNNEERGNPGLRRALIQNYDARWEFYPSSDEVFSISLFAKRFSEPIEKVFRATTGKPQIGFENAKGARNYGVEADARASLRSLGELGRRFSVFANATVMQSRIELDPLQTIATNPERPMAGQSPYVFNGGVTYANTNGRVSATVLYNVVGKRIVYAGVEPLPDTYEMPRHVLDLNVRFPLLREVSGRLNAQNLLDSPYVETIGDLDRRRYTMGRVFSLGLSWRP